MVRGKGVTLSISTLPPTDTRPSPPLTPAPPASSHLCGVRLHVPGGQAVTRSYPPPPSHLRGVRLHVHVVLAVALAPLLLTHGQGVFNGLAGWEHRGGVEVREGGG